MKGNARNVLLAAAAAGLALLLPAAARAQSSGYEFRKIALQGDPVPKPEGEIYESGFLWPAINSAGDVAFGAVISGSGPLNSGIFIDSGGSASAVALDGDPAPAPVGGTYSFFGAYPTLNDSGEVSFMAIVSGGSEPLGIFLDSGGTDAALILPGHTAPGTGDGGDTPDGTYTGNAADFNLNALNDSGGVAFRSEVTGGSVASGIFVDSGATEAAFALVGHSAPGTLGGTYSTFGNPSQNDAGSVAFTADVTGGSAASGVFRDSGVPDAAVALAGDPAPDTGGGTYTEFGFPVVNDLGYVVFLANVTGGSASGGVFLDTGGPEEAVAVEGGTAPDTGGGAYATVTSPGVLDVSGRVAFSATLTGGSLGAGVFLFHPASGQTSAVVLAGQTAPDAGATFSEFGFVSMNDAGQIAMQATLSDGREGIFLASPIAAAVPALPRSAWIGLLLSLLAVTAPVVSLRRSSPSGRAFRRD
jgi:hypothetical protein